MKILVSTDTSCLINYAMLNEYNISILPLNVIIDGEEFLDTVNINQEQLYEAIISNKKVKTTMPNEGKIIEYFSNLFNQGYEKIIHFTISSKLSKMYDSFTKISKKHFNNNIIVIDSLSLSSVMLSQVLYAYDEVQKETPIEEICLQIEALKKKNAIYLIPENLNQLSKNGWFFQSLAFIGDILRMKAVLTISNGDLKPDSTTRLVKNTFINKINKKLVKYPIEEYDYTIISYHGDEKIIDDLTNYIYEHTNGYNPIYGIIPINICANCGPGTIGIVVSPKYGGKSIKDYIL